jgi:CDI toxin RNase A-like protein
VLRRKIVRVGRFLLAALLALTACSGSDSGHVPPRQPAAGTAALVPAAARSAAASASAPHRDLSIDESSGGHTLARHVGRTDAQLADRLRAEPQIAAASTWTNRDTAERAIAAAIDAGGSRLSSWEHRSGRRPNLVLHYTDRSGTALGRSLARGARAPVPCTQALVVLRWDERRDRFYVLTAYPETER